MGSACSASAQEAATTALRWTGRLKGRGSDISVVWLLTRISSAIHIQQAQMLDNATVLVVGAGPTGCGPREIAGAEVAHARREATVAVVSKLPSSCDRAGFLTRPLTNSGANGGSGRVQPTGGG